MNKIGKVRLRAALPVVVAGLAAPFMHATARADDGPWELRVRAVNLDPANKSDAIPALAVPADAIHVNEKWLAELDAEYFFSPHWSAELIVSYPQNQTVTVAGTPIGSFKHLPPVLTAKYNFTPQSAFQPYVGVGVNVTLIFDVNLAVPGVGKLNLDSTSFGPALQTGFDYKIADHWYLNADVKWAKLSSDVKLAANGATVSTVHIDPFLFGLGIGYRFGAN
jgi:outer membrane protein